MKPSEIQIGTTYRIRSWQDMAAECGVDPIDGNIYHQEQCGSYFSTCMKHLCGTKYTPSEVSPHGECEPGADNDEWTICAFMLEPITDASPTLRIGRFTLRRHDAESLWIATEDGEGGQFRDEVVEEALGEMYKRYF